MRCDGAAYLASSADRLLKLAGGEAKLAALAAEDGDFDFSVLTGGRVRSLFEVGRWWEKEDRPGVERLRQQVMDEKVGYFMYDNGVLGDKVRRYACFAGKHSGADLVRFFQVEVPGGLDRAPGELLTETNVRCALLDLNLTLWGGRSDRLRAGASWRLPGVRWFALKKWPGCYLASRDGYRDGNVLKGYGIEIADVDQAHSSSLNGYASDLFELLQHLPDEYARDLRLLPSMRTPKRWSECYRNGGMVSSFLITRSNLCRYLDRFES